MRLPLDRVGASDAADAALRLVAGLRPRNTKLAANPDRAAGPAVRGGGEAAPRVWFQGAIPVQDAGAPAPAGAAPATAAVPRERARAAGRAVAP